MNEGEARKVAKEPSDLEAVDTEMCTLPERRILGDPSPG